jgi:hypothetical protein
VSGRCTADSPSLPTLISAVSSVRTKPSTVAAKSLCWDIMAARCVLPKKASMGPCTHGLLVKLSQSDCKEGCRTERARAGALLSNDRQYACWALQLCPTANYSRLLDGGNLQLLSIARHNNTGKAEGCVVDLAGTSLCTGSVQVGSCCCLLDRLGSC